MLECTRALSREEEEEREEEERHWIYTSEKPEALENGEQEVPDLPCSETQEDKNSESNQETSEDMTKDEQVEKSAKGSMKEGDTDKTAVTKMESVLEDWSKGLDEALAAAGDSS